MVFQGGSCAWLVGLLCLFFFCSVCSKSPCEEGKCCIPRPFIEIRFHLHFVASSATAYLDQGVRLEYAANAGWQPINYYTPSLLQAPGSTVTLNSDNMSVTAEAIQYTGSLPLHVVHGTEHPIQYKEYTTTSLGPEFQLRWSQLYRSVNMQQDRASWMLDNITVLQWDGLCTRTLLFEDFEGTTCSSSEKYKIGNAAGNCRESLYTRILYFNEYDGGTPRRFIIVNHIITSPRQDECEDIQLFGSACPAHRCENNRRCSPCPSGYVFNSSLQTCVEKYQGDNSSVECRNLSHCEGEVANMSVRQCCLEGAGISFSRPGSDECYTCIVYGWLNDSYIGRERYRKHILEVGFRKGSEAVDMSTLLPYDIIPKDGEGLNGAKAATDFQVLTKVAILNQFIFVVFLEDQIALEYDETFYLRLRARGSSGLSGPNVFFCDTIKVTVTDSDEVSVYFAEEAFIADEAELRIPVVVEKNRRIASPLTIQLQPLSIANIVNASTTAQPSYPNTCSCACEIDSKPIGAMVSNTPFVNSASPVLATVGSDFCGEVVVLIFKVDETLANPMAEATAYINITNDSVNEADQVFVVEMQVQNGLDNSSALLLEHSICKIIDDDAIRIGWSEHTYEVVESDNSVTMLLIKEDNVLSEQTFLIEVSVQPWSYFATSILPAIQLTQTSIERENIERDFAFPNKSIHLNLQFLPSIQVLPVELTIYDDTIAEGPEGILLHTDIEDRSPSYRIPVYSFSDTRVIIEDNDNITIGFEMDHIHVFEWVNMFEICLRYYNPPTLKTMAETELGAFRYEIQVDYESINGSAGLGTDYFPIPSTSVIFNDHYFCKCFNVTIVDNNFLENSETFSINITSYKLLHGSLYFDYNPTIDLRAGSIEVTIEDDDLTVIGFTSVGTSLDETTGSVTVTLNVTGADLELETIVASISTHDISATGGSDYSALRDQQFTFSAGLLELSIAVDIIDDFLYEHDEIFLVKMELISEPFPGLTIDKDNVSITIIDNDGITATLKGRAVSNHELLYFDEIGYNQSSGLICDGTASGICCEDYDSLPEGSGENGSQPNGIGSWITPDSTYVRYDCQGCVDVLNDTFQVYRTDNSTILYRNKNPKQRVEGIYRCEIPLSTNITEEEPLVQYVGIFERGQGTLILLRPIELVIVSTTPPLFQLHCATSGGPLTVVYWTRNDGDRIENDATFESTFVVVDFVNATYFHTLTVSDNYPGTYTFTAQDPFSGEEISDTHDVEDLCSECNYTTCEEGFQFDGIEGVCIDINECGSNHLNNCSSKANSECLNTIGSYSCRCLDNFVEFSNGNCGISVIALSTIVGSIGLLVLLTATIIAITMVYLHNKKRKMTAKISELSNSPEEKITDTDTDVIGLNYKVKGFMGIGLPKELFILASNLELGEPIGQGEFGIVFKARLIKDFGQRVTNTVAVKTLKGFHDDILVQDMLKECVKMLQFDHVHVLTLIGVCVDGGTAPYIVMPYMSNGSLQSYLKKFRRELLLPDDYTDQEQVELTLMKLMDMCIQVAKGMEYLTSKNLIHRDLAARNCMIDMNYVIKVADFGLSVTIGSKEYFRQDRNDTTKLPIRWLAIESMNDAIFSEKSDVWAFGVTCWEIFSGGKMPHATVKPINLLKLLEEGYRLEKPANQACSDEMYSMMTKCWDKSPMKRPTFSELVRDISLFLGTKAGYLDITQHGCLPHKSSSGNICHKNSSLHSLENLYT